MNNPNHSRTLATQFPTRMFHTRMEPLINTGALARWKDARAVWELFQEFVESSRKPLKRLIGATSSLHRAKAAVLMRTCGKAWRIWGLGASMLLAIAGSALAGVHYVDENSTNATPPFTNWTTAATNIQDAVDAAVVGDEILVTNGTYHPLTVGKPLSVRSINGPQFTTIDAGGSGRCAYLTNSASLSGFTLTNGFAYDQGGGVWCQSTNAVVSNCVIIGNRASASAYSEFASVNADGGGAYGGTLNDCTLTGNSVGGDYDYFGSFGRGDYGGQGSGAAYSTLNNCALTGNSAIVEGFYINTAHAQGGGAAYCTLNNCTLTGNSSAVEGLDIYNADAQGGGAFGCTLNNCTLTGNSVGTYIFVPISIIEDGGGASGSTLNNCILFGNSPDGDGGSPGSLAGNNWIGDPLFVNLAAGNLRLRSNSPCINAGNNSYATNATDRDGNPRIAGGTVDIGAYEFQSPVSVISYAWLQQYGLLPANGSTDTADPHGDGVDNYREWIAGTNPTNRFSSPAQLTITPSGVPPSGIILTWSTNAVGFTLQSTTNLSSPAVWSTNSPAPVVIAGQNTVTNPITGAQKFYRLVQ